MTAHSGFKDILRALRPALRFHIDMAPETEWEFVHALGRGNETPEFLRLSGWAFYPHKDLVLALCSGESVLALYKADSRRKDVGLQYQNIENALYSGFSLRIPVEFLAQTSPGELELRAYCQGRPTVLWSWKESLSENKKVREFQSALDRYYPERFPVAEISKKLTFFSMKNTTTSSSVSDELLDITEGEEVSFLLARNSDESSHFEALKKKLKAEGISYREVLLSEKKGSIQEFLHHLTLLPKFTPKYFFATDWQSIRDAFLFRFCLEGGEVVHCVSEDLSYKLTHSAPEEEIPLRAAYKSLSIPLFFNKLRASNDFIIPGIEFSETDALAPQLEHATIAKQAKFENSFASSSVSIIVPVYNALQSSLRALRSIVTALPVGSELIVVDDGSDFGTKAALKSFLEELPFAKFVQREENGGFIEACYDGVQAAEPNNDLLFINSDVVLASSSIENLLAGARRRAEIGMACSLSTGSHQFSFPLRPGDSLEQAASWLAQNVEACSPNVITPEGQFLLLKRWAVDRFGFFDRCYERGFCEESDLAMRFLLHGVETVCVENCIVAHEQSASFGKKGRDVAYERNRPIFEGRWGEYFSLAAEFFEGRDLLANIRSLYERRSVKLTKPVARYNDPLHLKELSLKKEDRLPVSSHLSSLLDDVEVAFLLPAVVAGGGSLSVLQHVNELLLRGIEARVFSLSQVDTGIYPLLAPPIAITPEEFISLPWGKQHVVATFWSTSFLVSAVTKRFPKVHGYYYVQDYEPWFYRNENQGELRKLAEETYTLPLQQVAKTHFLKSTVEELHSTPVSIVSPGIAREVFYPGRQQERVGRPRLAAMYRPETPRRGGQELLRVLDKVLCRIPELEVTLFGSFEGVPPELRERINLVGSLSQEEVAKLYREADITVDMSHWHGFGRMGIESMACGVVPILSRSGGVDEYARHGENCLMFDSSRPDDAIDHIVKLALDKNLWSELRAEALMTASKWSDGRAVDDWLTLFGLSEEVGHQALPAR